jgi:hypothetical protein
MKKTNLSNGTEQNEYKLFHLLNSLSFGPFVIMFQKKLIFKTIPDNS